MPTTPGHLPPKVIIIGAGIAGPILAIFLKCHGYNPVIYERQPKSAPEGIALAYVVILSRPVYFGPSLFWKCKT